MGLDTDSPAADQLPDPRAAGRSSRERPRGLAGEPHPDAVRTPDFFDRRDESEDEAILTCRECAYEFALPGDWCDAHRGEHVGCPNCSLTSRIPVHPTQAGVAR